MAADIYENIVVEHDIQAVKRLFKLDGLADSDKPTHMEIPEEYHSVEWIKYDVRQATGDPAQFRDVTYMYPREFVDLVNARNPDESNVFVATDPTGVTLNVLTDKAPTYYTLFDDRHVVFDSYNSVVESSLHQNKTQAYGQMSSQLVIDDDTEIYLPAELMPMYKSEVRQMYLDVHGGGAPSSVVRQASKSRVRSQRLRHTMRNSREQFKHTGPDYGRRPR